MFRVINFHINRNRFLKVNWTVASLAVSIFIPMVFGIQPYLIIALMIVLSFHEIGHLIAMLYFKYENISMTFIPFVGAMVRTDTIKDTRINKIIIYLAGPIPGLILGLLLNLIIPEIDSDFLEILVFYLIFLNAINLLPLAILDGGQVIENLYFTRSDQLAWFNFISGKIFFIYCILSKEYYLLPLYVYFFLRFYIFYTEKDIMTEYRLNDKIHPAIKTTFLASLLVTYLFLIHIKFWIL